MEVEFQLTRSEYQHSAWRMTWTQTDVRRYLYLFPIYAPLLLIVLLILMGFSLGEAIQISWRFSPVFACVMLIAPALFHIKFGLQFDRLAALPDWGPGTLRLAAEGVFYTCQAAKAEHLWKAIRKLHEDDLGFYLYISPLTAYYVPRRAFDSQAKAEQFWELAQAYRELAGTGPDNAAD